MGEDAGTSDQSTRERPSLEGVLIVDTYDFISSFYSLDKDEAFQELTEYLTGLSCRDQELESAEVELPAGVTPRAEGHRLATNIRDDARRMVTDLDSIR